MVVLLSYGIDSLVKETACTEEVRNDTHLHYLCTQGTFQAEEDHVVYGLTHPLMTWDPVWAQVVCDLFVWLHLHCNTVF